MKHQSVAVTQIVRACVSITLLCIGILLFSNVLDAGDPKFWLSAVLVLSGVFVSTSAPGVAFALAAMGGYMLLRDMGVIVTPWLGYGISLVLVLVGIYGIITSLYAKQKTPVDTEKSETEK